MRREDIPELVNHFLARHAGGPHLAISDAAMDALRQHEWPGNVRELGRLIERMIAFSSSERLELEDLPPQVCGRYGEVLGPSVAAGDSMRAWGSRYARLVYERCGRNKRAASRALDISYHTLEAYLQYGASATPRRGLPEWTTTVQTACHQSGSPVSMAAADNCEFTPGKAPPAVPAFPAPHVKGEPS
jgi:DNA-binding NtrC family response regulator